MASRLYNLASPLHLAAILLVMGTCSGAALANPQDLTDSDAIAPADDPSRIERWDNLKKALFGNREVLEGTAVVHLDAPSRAANAALVPLTLKTEGGKELKSIYLVIDDNPSPLAGHVTFGPKADPSTLSFRVRVNAYTLIHAVAESQTGDLYGASTFVKATGGCSAPAGADESDALRNVGSMEMKLLTPYVAGRAMQVQLAIHHPNFNGMQMNQITRMVTPARFIKTTEITFNGAGVLRLDSDISMSTDPVMTFAFVPEAAGTLAIHVVDSDGKSFEQAFHVPEGTHTATTLSASAQEHSSQASQVAEPADFWDGPVNSPTPETLSGGRVIRAKELAALLKAQHPVVVDVSNSPKRPDNLAPEAVWMPSPHPALPATLWLAGVGAGTLNETTDRFFRRRLSEATNNDMNHSVVIYCHERCWLSWNAAKRAVRYGYRRVYWFPDGIEGWKSAGFAATVAQPESPAPQDNPK